ncbi:MAG: polyprenyl synthetase family protein [Francisellaceae bacterium]|nr:polyprenyl synthetase family protein [Francisellaceae bacterium]
MDIEHFLKQTSIDITKTYKENVNIDHSLMQQIMDYAFLGGKGIRAALVVLTGQAFGANYSNLMIPALAVELIHSYSLVHDDLPAMDNDSMRRGKASTHNAFGEANAILTGDALLTQAFICISSSCLNDATKILLIQELSKAAGANGMIAGQMMDMAAQNQITDYEHLCNIHNLKTGAIISASVLMGAYTSSSYNIKDIDNLKSFSRHIGLAFQVYDDLLDVTKDSKTLGKPANSDVDNNKATFPALIGIEQTRELVEVHTNLAKQSLTKLNVKTEQLSNFVEYIIQREF